VSWLFVTLDDLNGKVTVSPSGDHIPETTAELASSKVTMSQCHVAKSKFTADQRDAALSLCSIRAI
jgi:hypothetical protein